MMMGGGLLVLVAVVALAIYVARGGFGLRPPDDQREHRPEAREILEERFARGEISEDEFEQRRQALERTSSSMRGG